MKKSFSDSLMVLIAATIENFSLISFLEIGRSLQINLLGEDFLRKRGYFLYR
jgi:hypothetical protein